MKVEDAWVSELMMEGWTPENNDPDIIEKVCRRWLDQGEVIRATLFESGTGVSWSRRTLSARRDRAFRRA